ncbi:MAG: hypothetical protein U0234_22695 [Sandaracinus sp.]
MFAWEMGLVRTLATAVALGIALASSPVAAQGAETSHVVTLEAAPPDCPDEGELERRVGALVRAPSAGVTARVTIAGAEPSLEARVEIVRDGSSAIRTLHGRSCDALSSTVALVIAMVIDPTAAERAVQAQAEGTPEAVDPGETESQVETEAEVETEADVVTEPAIPIRDEEPPPHLADQSPPSAASSSSPPSPPPAISFVAEALFVGSAGLLPQPTFGGLVLAGVRIEGVELSLGATVLAESRAQTTSTRGGDFGLAQGRFRVAYAFELAPVELVPAVAIDVGATWGRGYGVVHPGAGTALSVDVAIGAEARVFFLRELGVVLFGELDFPTLRPSFVLTGISTTPVFRANDVATVFGLGLIARVP